MVLRVHGKWGALSLYFLFLSIHGVLAGWALAGCESPRYLTFNLTKWALRNFAILGVEISIQWIESELNFDHEKDAQCREVSFSQLVRSTF